MWRANDASIMEEGIKIERAATKKIAALDYSE